MPLTARTIGDANLDALASAVGLVYQRKDELRSLWDIWLHTNHHVAGVAEEIRKGAFGPRLIEELAHFTVWLFTITEKLQGEIGVRKYPVQTARESVVRVSRPLSDILWTKYPAVCPVCHWRRAKNTKAPAIGSLDAACDCLQHDQVERTKDERHQHVATLRKFARDTFSRKPATIDEWQAMFAGVFAEQLSRLHIKDFALHLLEEAGEVSDAMARLYTYRDENFIAGEPSWRQIKLEDEIADLTSRLFTLIEKINLSRNDTSWQIHTPAYPLRLSSIVWQHYGSESLHNIHCPFCRKPICVCPIILIPETHSVDEVRRRAIPVL